jgi:uncharacterized protein (TIGR00255 family)
VLRDVTSLGDVNEISESELKVIKDLVAECSRLLCEDREVEGAGLVKDIEPRVAAITVMRESISERVAGNSNRFRDRVSERLAGLEPEVRIDPERLALEVALLADRVDVCEELSRLGIHLVQFTQLLQQGSGEGIGRKLDFTVQEIGRELNTIGSKAQDAQVQGIVVEAKTELERIREQVQNIE